MIKFTINNRSRRLLFRLTGMPEAVRSAISDSFIEWGEELVRTAENSALNEAKYGRWYPNEIKKLHRASAPGQTPAVFDGEWFDGLGFKSNGTELEFGNDAEHARYLELGTPIMEPRPGLRNAIDSTVRNFRSDFDKNIMKELI